MDKNKNPARVVFMGSGAFALVILTSLLENGYEVCGFYTQSSKKQKKDGEEKSEIEAIAEENKIPVFHPEHFGKDQIGELSKLNPDLLIVAAYGKILPETVLKVPRMGALNVHPSMIPKFRGPSPIQNAILAGEKSTGVTIMLMDQGIDTGGIIKQKEYSIEPDETYPELLKKLSFESSKLLLETLPDWIEKKIKPIAQKEDEATLCQLIERSDGHVVWTEDAENIYNRYRAFVPWPGLYSFWEKDGYNQRIKLKKISVIKSNPETMHKSGEVFEIGDKTGVQTGKGVVILEELQLEGKNAVKTEDFLNGNRELVGSILK